MTGAKADSTVQVLRKSAWDEEMRQTAAAVEKATGCEVVYVLKGIELQTGDFARGVYTGDRIIIQCDHNKLSVKKIGAHEAFHAFAARDRGLVSRLRERILEAGGGKALDETLGIYIQKLAKSVGLRENMDADSYEAAMNKIVEEIFADAYAGINAYGAEAAQFRAPARETVDRRRGKENAAATARKTGPPDSTFSVEAAEEDRIANLTGEKAATRAESLYLSITDPKNIARYLQEVESVLDDTMQKNQMVLVGKSPELLRKYLKSEKPLYIVQKGIKKAVLDGEKTAGKHGLGRAVIDELPYELENPLAITGNTSKHEALGDNSIVVWTDWKTSNGDHVIVPIGINNKSNLGTVNIIRTVFDARDELYVKDLLRENNVLYTRNGKSIDELLAPGREVPKWKPENASSEDNVTESNPEVKDSFSIDEDTDADYLAAVERGDMDTAQRMVDEAAEVSGWTVEMLYHGSPAIGTGITTFDLDKGQGTIFTTSSKDTAKTYAGSSRIRPAGWKFDAESQKEFEAIKAEYKEWAKKWADRVKSTADAMEAYSKAYDVYRAGGEANFEGTDIPEENRIIEYDIYAGEGSSQDLTNLMDLLQEMGGNTIDLKRDIMRLGGLRWSYPLAKTIWDDPNKPIIDVNDPRWKGETGGIYKLYAKEERPLIVFADYANWDEIGSEYGNTPREIAEYAKKNGYDSVIIRDLYDLGPTFGMFGIAMDEDGEIWGDDPEDAEAADIHIVFDSSQVKSADPVTYDDEGNVIPLSERFNAEKEDIRYSTEEDEETGSRKLLGTTALDRIGVKVSGSVGKYGMTESLLAKERAAKSLQREARKAEKRLRATDAEKEFANGITAGIYREEDIPKRMNRDTVMELADYYWALNSANLQTLHQLRSDINQGLRDEAGALLEDADIKPQSMILLNERTPERSFRAMFGDRAGGMTKFVLDPVRENEAEKIRWYNKQMDAVRKFTDSEGKSRELTRVESGLTMRVMEGRAAADMVAGMETAAAIRNAAHNIRNGEAPGDAAQEFGLSYDERDLAVKLAGWMQTQEDLKTADTTIIEAAAKKYAEIFDEYYDAINDFLVAHGYEPIGYIRGYAPHMQPEENQNLLNKALGAMGINTEVTQLPASIAGQTAFFRPNKRWNPYFLQRTGDTAEYDIVKAYQSYVDYMADVLFHMDDVMRLRQTANWIRQTYAPEEIRNQLEWARDLMNAPTEDKQTLLRDAGEIGQNTVLSAVDTEVAMQAYVDKLYDRISKTTKHGNLVMWLDNFANIMAGKQSMADRGWEYSTGRKGLNWANRLSSAFQKANVAGNLSSILNQSAQLPMIAAELGKRDFTRALLDITAGRTRAWAADSDFLAAKAGKEMLYTDNAEKFVNILFAPANAMDTLVATVAVRGAYNKAIRQGMNHAEAMKKADDFGQAVMGSRAKGSRPLAYESKGFFSKLVHMFQVEAVNSWDHVITDVPYEIRRIAKTEGKPKAAAALAAIILRALIGAFALNRLTEEIYGGTPAPFDILGLTANFVASGKGLSTNAYIRTIMDNVLEKNGAGRIFGTEPMTKEDFDLEAAADDLIYNVMNDVPLARNVAGVLGLGDQTVPLPGAGGEFKALGTAVKGMLKDGVEPGEIANLLRAMGETVTQFVPGGRQINKTAQGAEAVLRGGSYKNGKLQYPLEGTADTIRALAFGKNATNAAKGYWAAGGKALSERQTGIYQGMVDEGMTRQEAYRTVTGYRDEGTLDTFVRWQDSDAKKAGVDERTYIDFRTAVTDMTADKDENGKTISNSKKNKVVGFINGLALTPAQKDALYFDAGYAESTLKDTPWHKGGSGDGRKAPARMPTLKLPEAPKAEKSGNGLRISAGEPAQRQSSGLRIGGAQTRESGQRNGLRLPAIPAAAPRRGSGLRIGAK